MSTTEAYLDLYRDAPVAMLDHEITDRRAWTRDTVTAADWTVPLSTAAIAEILSMADTVTRQPLPVLMLSPDQFDAAGVPPGDGPGEGDPRKTASAWRSSTGSPSTG